MKKSVLFVMVIMMLTGINTSCSKGGAAGGDDGGSHIEAPSDVTAPVLVINTPTTNQVFTSGSTINVTGKITDDLGLYRGTIKITNDANGEVLKNQAFEIHGILTYDYNISYTPSVTITSNYTVTVSFEDHGSNSTTQTVKIKVNP